MKSHMKIPNDQQNERQTFGSNIILSPYKQKLKMAGNIVVLYRSSKTPNSVHLSTITEEAPRHGSILQQKLYFDYIIYFN